MFAGPRWLRLLAARRSRLDAHDKISAFPETALIMQQAFGLNIPQTLDDVCDPSSLALIIYDMQVGIVNQVKDGAEITARVQLVLNTARAARVRVFFTRHLSLPK